MEKSKDWVASPNEENDKSIFDQRRTLHQQAAAAMAQYLEAQSEDLRRLADLRRQGWNNPAGDTFFQRQRQNADDSNLKMNKIFYQLMRRIGNELHQITNVFIINSPDGEAPKILDMCMAPGGFLETALRICPASTALAFSLPVRDGGFEVLIPRKFQARVERRFADITMFAHDMGMQEIPESHIDALNFTSRQLDPSQLFHLVICDGQVLRTHERSAYREPREATRLTTSQLAIGLEHLHVGGAMVVLLHRLDSYGTAKLIRDFCCFSTVQLYKPKTGHVKRSSFYMIASNVQSHDIAALEAIQKWKQQWRVATFDSDQDNLELLRDDLKGLDAFLNEFGIELVKMGKAVWQTQADGLARSPFIKNQDGLTA